MCAYINQEIKTDFLLKESPWGGCSFFSLLVIAGGMAGCGMILALPCRVREPLAANLVSYATGTLLGAVFLGLLPDALEKAPPSLVVPWFLAGILAFFLIEKLVLWRHCHKPECDVHANPGLLLMVGDGVHNFIDGVIIAGAFLLSVPLGVITGLTVLAHEIPQELGDVAVLLDSGYSRSTALLLNLLSALTTLPGGFLGPSSPDGTDPAVSPGFWGRQFPLYRLG